MTRVLKELRSEALVGVTEAARQVPNSGLRDAAAGELGRGYHFRPHR